MKTKVMVLLIGSLMSLATYASALGYPVEGGYPATDEQIYKALRVQEQYASRGTNSIRYQKTVGDLTCTKVISKMDNVVVGYLCELIRPTE